MAATLVEQIKLLAELQKIDSEIYSLKRELALVPEKQKKAEAEFEKKKTGLKTAEEDLKHLQLKQKQLDGDLAAREEKILKLQGQLYTLKSNKEYSAMDLEIKGMKADKSLLEEDILKTMDAVEAAKAVAVREKAALAEEDKKFKISLDELKKDSDQLGQQLGQLEEKRKTYTPNVEPRHLSQYERILKGRDGLAIVPVVSGACGGCHLDLPPQVVNETQLHDKWITCESCARILYWPS